MERYALALTILLVLSIGCGDEETPTAADTTPPSAVSDLEVHAVTSTSVTLTWTAPGDDGDRGTAAAYDVRYSVDPMTDELWAQSPQVDDVPPPQTAAAGETLVVNELEPDRAYYFALKTADEIPNWSGISNVATATTAANSPPHACFSFSPVAGTPSTTFNFDASCSSDSDDPMARLTFSWDWENDGIYDEEDLTIRGAHHRYDKPGTYEVALRVEDWWGASDTVVVQIEVLDASFLVMADGTGDGANIQEAIDAAEDGDLILLWPGTFQGHGNRDIDYRGKAIEIRSVNGDPEECVIDCQGSESENHRGFIFRSGESSEAVLASVTITHAWERPDGGGITCLDGSNPTLMNCILVGNTAYRDGPGIFCSDSDPTIRDCELRDNTAMTGGGALHCSGSDPMLTGCRFLSNSALGGGGMSCEDSAPVMEDCVFDGNTSYSHGGGLILFTSDPVVTNCTFSNNWAENGGGLQCTNSDPDVRDCTFRANSAEYGGAIRCSDSFPVFTNCIFEENSASDGAGAECSHSPELFSLVTFVECSFTQNEATSYGGAIASSTQIELTECLMAANSAYRGGALHLVEDSVTLTNCTLADNFAVTAGGAVYFRATVPELAGCTISGNSAGMSGGGLYLESAIVYADNTIISFSTEGESIHCDVISAANLTCCDVYGNEGGDWVGCIEDQLGVDGNISADPLFCQPESGDYRLQQESPCSPDSSGCGLIGAWEIGCD